MTAARASAAALCALAACAPPDAAPRWRPAGTLAPARGGTLRFAIPTQAFSLDPTFTSDELTAYATHALFDTLVAFEPASPADARAGLRIVPGLAESWDESADGLTYRFVLRAGLVYSDGTPVVADDVRAVLERQLRTPGTLGTALLADVEGAPEVIAGSAPHLAGVTAPTARELVIQLARPNASFLSVMTMTFTTPQPAGRAPDRRAPLGTGPYVLAAWDEGERLVLRKNPRYWDAAHVYLDEIDMLENIAPDTQFLMFERGELDTAQRLDAPDALWIQQQAAWAPYVWRRPTLSAFGSRMNVRVKPFDDRRVRQALNYALDKSHTVKLLQGAATIAHGVLPPGLLGRDDALAPYPHDPVKARALLAEAGYPDGFDVDYLIMANDEASRLAASLQADLAEVGVRVHVRSVAFATYATEIASAHGAPFAKATWLFDYPDPANVFDTEFHSRGIPADGEGATNIAFYATPELDALLDAARGERDLEARAAMYRRAERIVYDDAPWLWDYHQDTIEVVQPYVAGYAPHPVWIRDYTHAWLDVGPDGEPVRR